MSRRGQFKETESRLTVMGLEEGGMGRDRVNGHRFPSGVAVPAAGQSGWLYTMANVLSAKDGKFHVCTFYHSPKMKEKKKPTRFLTK